MTTEVFNGLVQVICELYLDDLIVFAQSEAVEELKTARQDMAVILLNGESGHSHSWLRRDDKIIDKIV